MFTINRLGLSPSRCRCLSSTNVIESPHSCVRLRTRRICRWRDGRMVLRGWSAAFLMTEKNFRCTRARQEIDRKWQNAAQNLSCKCPDVPFKSSRFSEHLWIWQFLRLAYDLLSL